ncbi:MAG: hypothetical protein ACTHMC_21950 [Pseudobacter sp.]|uniref:hypothetical protein n=1 Tax=Pseudobacter sp. TaxID=2045420 RepID=UPI003F7F8D7E
MRFLVILLALHIPFVDVKAAPSPQIPDYIIFRNDTLATYTLILEQYLDKKDNKNIQLFGLRFSDEASLNCWRGCQAIYKIENDSLFLVDIIDCGGLRHINKKESLKRIKSLFGEKIVNERVYIDWFSGSIKFPLSDKVLRWDGVFYKIFEKETVINITAGKVLTIQNVSNYVHVRN